MTDRQDTYIPPKKPYSFLAMLDDILAFAASTLVDGGRVSLWMPTANEDEEEQGELKIPTHPCLRVQSICLQSFNKCALFSPCHPKPNLTNNIHHAGSRRLLTYTRLPGIEPSSETETHSLQQKQPQPQPTTHTASGGGGTTANDLNAFRKRVRHPYSSLSFFPSFLFPYSRIFPIHQI